MNTDYLITTLKKEISRISVEANKKKIKSAYVISTTSKRSGQKWIPLPIRETKYVICGAITVYDMNQAKKIAKYVDNKVDYIFVDAEIKLQNMDELVKQISLFVKKSKILTFKNNDLTASSADALISKILKNFYNKKIAIIGAGNIGGKLSLKLIERGAQVYLASKNLNKTRTVAKSINNLKPKHCSGRVIVKDLRKVAKNTDLLIGLTPDDAVISPEMIQVMKSNGIIIDGGVGTISLKAINDAFQKGIHIMRLDTRAGFAGEVSLLFETEKILDEIQGKATLGEIDVVAGGEYGKNGDVVLDNLSKPKRVLGIADGKGGILHKQLNSTNLRHLKLIKSLVEKGKKIKYD